MKEQDNTPREANGRWLKGQSANPAGRPQSSRQRISEKLLIDLAEVWEVHGKEVLVKLAVSDPAKLATIAYGLLPRDVFVSVQQQQTLDGDKLQAVRRLIDIIESAGVESEDELRARLALPVK